MSYNPYTAPRSTTPPLYYRRPEGVPQSYYTVQAQREVHSLSIPGFPAPQVSSARAEDRPPNSGAPLSAAVPIPPSPRLAVAPSPSSYPPRSANPFPSGGGTLEPLRPSDGAVYGGGHHAAAVTGRWSYQQPQRQDEESRRVVQLEAEETAIAAEEAALKARRTELLAVRRRQEEEQLRLSEGWAMLLEREERYYTEPVPDYSQDIHAREQQCVALREQLQQAESHRGYLETQLDNYGYVLKDKEAAEKEVARVREGLQGVEQRRRACVARAERFFDVEVKRVGEASRAARKLDAQLKDMTSSGPLAQLQNTGSASRSQSRCVNFAPADKSIVIDIGRNGSLSTSVSVEPNRRDTQEGLSQDEESSGSASANGGRHRPLPSGNATGASLGGASLCFGLQEEEEDGLGIGGTSAVLSLNNSTRAAVAKRRKVELAV